ILVNGLVVVIEAHPDNYKILVENILINYLKNVKPLNLAAWNKNCNLKLFTGKSSDRHSLKRNLQILLGNALSKESYIFGPAKPVDDIVGDIAARYLFRGNIKVNKNKTIRFLNELGYRVEPKSSLEDFIAYPNYGND
ncbi:MAG: hypothetical protein ACPL07_03575, partial [Candidatus Bathyarchaeia archaeon]